MNCVILVFVIHTIDISSSVFVQLCNMVPLCQFKMQDDWSWIYSQSVSPSYIQNLAQSMISLVLIVLVVCLPRLYSYIAIYYLSLVVDTFSNTHKLCCMLGQMFLFREIVAYDLRNDVFRHLDLNRCLYVHTFAWDFRISLGVWYFHFGGHCLLGNGHFQIPRESVPSLK